MTVSRKKLLAGATALAAFGPVLLGPFISAAEAADEGDISILQVAIKLERAGIKAYTDAAGTGLLQPAVLSVAKGFLRDHTAHRDALIGAVSAAGVTPTGETTSSRRASSARPQRRIFPSSPHSRIVSSRKSPDRFSASRRLTLRSWPTR